MIVPCPHSPLSLLLLLLLFPESLSCGWYRNWRCYWLHRLSIVAIDGQYWDPYGYEQGEKTGALQSVFGQIGMLSTNEEAMILPRLLQSSSY